MEATAVKDFHIMRMGVLNVQICSSLPIEEVIQRLEAEYPCGTRYGWQVSNREGMAPIACENEPQTHTHYMLDA